LTTTYSLEDLVELRNRDIDILRHNRQLFIDKPYDSLYEKIVEVMKKI